MTGCLLWLQHASQDSASWYRYLSVCGLTNFTHWRAKLITDNFSKKKRFNRLTVEGRTFPGHKDIFYYHSLNVILIFICRSMYRSELGSSQPVVVCFAVDKNSLSEVGQSARMSSPACNLCFLPQPSSHPDMRSHTQQPTLCTWGSLGIYRVTRGEETAESCGVQTDDKEMRNIMKEAAAIQGRKLCVSYAMAFAVARRKHRHLWEGILDNLPNVAVSVPTPSF